MGRYYYYVHKTVLAYLNRERIELDRGQRNSLAHEFAAAYVKAAYENWDKDIAYAVGYTRLARTLLASPNAADLAPERKQPSSSRDLR